MTDVFGNITRSTIRDAEFPNISRSFGLLALRYLLMCYSHAVLVFIMTYIYNDLQLAVLGHSGYLDGSSRWISHTPSSIKSAGTLI
jgi:hypothetical protein